MVLVRACWYSKWTDLNNWLTLEIEGFHRCACLGVKSRCEPVFDSMFPAGFVEQVFPKVFGDPVKTDR